MKISLCIITLNEAEHLPRCLRSAAGLADETIVLDSGSTDDTGRIAADFGARFEHQPWLGFVGQKNAALARATHPWILSLDGDEELSPALRAEIQAVKETEPAVQGFSMPRCVLYEGRWIRHGDWYPDRLVRLFRKDGARYSGGKVHERLEIKGPIQKLHGDIFHHSFKDAADHWARCEKYARLWAETQHEVGRRAGPLVPASRAIFRLLRAYLLKRGFLDGSLGWRIARYSAAEVHLKYKLLRQLNQNNQR